MVAKGELFAYIAEKLGLCSRTENAVEYTEHIIIRIISANAGTEAENELALVE